MAKATLTADLLNVYQVAELLGRSVATIYVWNESGFLPAPIELGGRYRWRLRDLQTWVDAGCPQRAPEPKNEKVKT